MTVLRFLLVLISLLFVPLPAAAEEPVYLYQRIHVLIAHHDNRISLRLWVDGTVEMRFPSYTPQAGVQRWTASAQERAQLDAFFGAASRQDPHLIETARARSDDGELIYIADADIVRFEVRDAGRAPRLLMIEAPDAWSRALPQSAALQELAQTERDLLAWMRGRASRAAP